LDKPEKAVAAGLLDGLKYDDQVRDEIRQRLKIGKTDKINFISLAKYSKAVNVSGAYSKDKIALVLAEGEIVYGKGSPDQIGSDEYLALLRKLRTDKSVKAIVLRVNSPGGSSLASEIIWRELELIRKEGSEFGAIPVPLYNTHDDNNLPNAIMDNNIVYNQKDYPSFDSHDQGIGLETPLDKMFNENNNNVSPNPMDHNWGGSQYTQSLIDKGVYADNEVTKATFNMAMPPLMHAK
jgi:hypothetical protein